MQTWNSQKPFGLPAEGPHKTMGALAQDIVARNRDWQTGKLTTKGQLEVQNLYAEDAIKRSNAALGHAKEKMRKMSPEEFKREADIMELMRPRRLY